MMARHTHFRLDRSKPSRIIAHDHPGDVAGHTHVIDASGKAVDGDASEGVGDLFKAARFGARRRALEAERLLAEAAVWRAKASGSIFDPSLYRGYMAKALELERLSLESSGRGNG